MRKIWPGFLAVLLLLLTGCQGVTTEEPVPTDTAVAPTVKPMEEPVVGENYCISCHIDKEQLIATAKPEEVIEEEIIRSWLRGRCGSVGAMGKSSCFAGRFLR